MSEIKDYGEPWSVSARSQRSIFIDNSGGITVASASQQVWSPSSNTATADRIVACVNALAGRDPEKLEGLLEAVRHLIKEADYIDDAVGDSSAGDRCAAALAAFEGDDK